LEFWGNSFVARSVGQVVSEAPTTRKKSWSSECDPPRAKKLAATGRFSVTGRIDAYQANPQSLARRQIGALLGDFLALAVLCLFCALWVLSDLCVKFFPNEASPQIKTPRALGFRMPAEWELTKPLGSAGRTK